MDLRNLFVQNYNMEMVAYDLMDLIDDEVLERFMLDKFGEDFMEWIKTQQMLRNLPKINGAHSIECTSPSYILQKTETTAIYIIQMNFTYYELS